MNTQVDPNLLEKWCEQWLNRRPGRTLFKTGHLSAVHALELSGGQPVIVKIRLPLPRVLACTEVQHHMWKAGFPCPRPLAGPAPLGEFIATAEEYIPDGEELPIEEDSPCLFAEGLANLVALSADAASVHSLEPPPPWVWWQHREAGVWPVPDDRTVDLNAYREPRWLDEIGDRVRKRLLQCSQPAIVGHADWISQNNDGRTAKSVWFMIGTVSRPYPKRRLPAQQPRYFRPTANHSLPLQSINAMLLLKPPRMQEAASGPITNAKFAGAGLWVRLFDAKKEASSGSAFAREILANLANEINTRLRHAGLE